MLTFSSRNLSADCSSVVPDRDVKGAEIDAETAVQRLRAFAGQPAVNLVGSDALVYLANADFKLAVQHENGRLFATRVPEASNTAIEQTPEEIVGQLDRTRTVPPPPQSTQSAGAARVGWRRWRERMNSGWLVGVLAVVAVVAAYLSFSPEVPEGVAMISDPAKVAALNTTFNGTYGETVSAGSALLVVADGRFAVYPAGANGTAGEPLMDSTYRYGLRGDQVVLVVANGAVLEPDKAGSLRFDNAVYPRIAPR